MLQPVQLKEVSFRYANEIAELRDFLGKAGFKLGTAGTLDAVAAGLERDRAFHRDLTLYVWLLIDRSGGKISPSDLLGVLAIAAAGQQFAAEANEADAHDLLRFVMEARRSMDAPTARRAAEFPPRTTETKPIPAERTPSVPAEPTVIVPVEPTVSVPVEPTVSIPVEPLVRVPAEPTVSVPVEPPISVPAVDPAGVTPRSTPPVAEVVAAEPAAASGEETVESAEGKRIGWIVAIAACLLAAVSVGLWQYHKMPRDTPRSGARVAGDPVNILDVFPEKREAPRAASHGEAVPTDTAASNQARPATASAWRELSARRAREASGPAPSPAPPTSRDIPPAAAPIVRTPPSSESATNAMPMVRPGTSVPIPAGAARPGAARPAVPAATLSKQLGSSTVPAYASSPDADATTDSRKYPRLLRRRTPSSGGNGSLVSELRPAGTPNASGSAPTVPVGVVRPTSLGITAGNLLYSPTPAYPAAAAAAHVQGEVKVQAEIDRDGNVVAARVVSGPPMLRDAAVDAIQHWRYKPWTSGGKTVPMSALAVVDFQLP